MPYTPHSDDDIRAMLERVGVGSIEELFDGIPEALRIGRPLEIPRALSEADLFREMAGIAAANRPLGDRPSFLGGGCYHHFIPAAVDALSSRGEFLTAYTPYQPEVSQGTLRTIYEFQSFIALLTGMEIANASMYDGATAAAEAVAMAASLSKGSRVLVSEGVHPETRRVLETFLSAYPFEIDVIPLDGERTAPERVRKRLEGAFAFLYQSPNYLGAIEAEAE
ncbi:MAG: glycine dehydrogenase, partial [Planctomycetota bacterium]